MSTLSPFSVIVFPSHPISSHPFPSHRIASQQRFYKKAKKKNYLKEEKKKEKEGKEEGQGNSFNPHPNREDRGETDDSQKDGLSTFHHTHQRTALGV